MNEAIDNIKQLIQNVASRISEKSLDPGERMYLSLRPIRSFAWYIGCSDSGFLIAILETPFKSNRNFKTQTKSIACYSSTVNNYSLYRLSFELLEHDDLSLFSQMMEDIILASLTGRDEIVSKKAIERFSMWQNMLKAGGANKNKYKGLLGELIIFQLLLDRFNSKIVIDSWIGPESKEKDYCFSDFWIEVKTVSSEALDVKITSLQQLDSPVPGYLSVCKIEETDSHGITCYKLFEEIQNRIDSLPDIFAFRNKIEELGFMSVILNPVQYEFKLISTDVYKVMDFPGKKFPRLISSMGHPAIKSVEYSLTLAAIEDWRFSDVLR